MPAVGALPRNATTRSGDLRARGARQQGALRGSKGVAGASKQWVWQTATGMKPAEAVAVEAGCTPRPARESMQGRGTQAMSTPVLRTSGPRSGPGSIFSPRVPLWSRPLVGLKEVTSPVPVKIPSTPAQRVREAGPDGAILARPAAAVGRPVVLPPRSPGQVSRDASMGLLALGSPYPAAPQSARRVLSPESRRREVSPVLQVLPTPRDLAPPQSARRVVSPESRRRDLSPVSGARATPRGMTAPLSARPLFSPAPRRTDGSPTMPARTTPRNVASQARPPATLYSARGSPFLPTAGRRPVVQSGYVAQGVGSYVWGQPVLPRG